jgi:biotin transport system substrate-specific component
MELAARVVSPQILADAAIPQTRPGAQAAVRSAILIVAGALLTAAAAQLSVLMPWSPVPYTGQTAAVLLVGTVLGARDGFLSMLLYVALGVVGAPVYAGGEAGLSRLLGVTGGYLVGFVVASLLVGRLAELGWDRTPLRAGLLMVAGTLVIYAIGVPVLALVGGIPFPVAVEKGALVFLPWDIFKVVVAAALLPLAWRLVGRRSGR